MANSNSNTVSRPVAIYALLDRNFDTRYIGQSVNPEKRFKIHKWEKKWPVNYEVIEWVSGAEWKQSEIYWIWKYGSDGYHLCNRTIGGEGATGLTPEALERKRAGLKRSWLTRDRTVSAATRQKLSKANMGKVIPQDVRDRISSGMKGVSSQWLKGRKQSPEALAKRTAKQKGMKRSAESKKRYAESKRGRKNPRYGKRPWNYGLKGFRAGPRKYRPADQLPLPC